MREIAYAKVNIFLKIVGKRGSYHEIVSRFMQVKNLYDVISFEMKDTPKDGFEIDGEFSCKLEENSIYKAYLAIKNKEVEDFFSTYKVVVEKNIPEFAGLGGGSSDCGSFLRLANKVLDLNIDIDKLAQIGAKIGADVPFFVYNFKSANVSGIGEIVKEFDEQLLDIKTLTPDIKCDTAKVYKRFSQSYLNRIDKKLANELMKKRTHEILDSYTPKMLNDLYAPSLDLYPELSNYDGYFSGSGSTFFKVGDGKE